jgi:hypothetical protein
MAALVETVDKLSDSEEEDPTFSPGNHSFKTAHMC